jgi:hypothetical protein
MSTSPRVKRKPTFPKPDKDMRILEVRVTKLEKQMVQLLMTLKRQKVSSKRFLEELRTHATDAYNFKKAVNKQR